ncbi:MAG: response regulator [Clostridiales Family XIII bacterium]|jgi:signal transduction histidine kinase|nr:response regulator [Clostridiales Family XIII bacterium]
MKRLLGYSVQGKIVAILLVFMTLTLVVSWFSIRYVSQTTITKEKEQKLTAFAEYLVINLGDRTYEDILAEHGALDASHEEKIAVLNEELKTVPDELAAAYTGLGVGYYSRDLDAIVAYGPSSQFQETVGTPIAENHPGRTVMRENKSSVRSGAMVRGKIMNAMFPIEKNGEVIGYTWANELTTDIEKQFNEVTQGILLLICAFYVIAVTIAILLSRRTMRDVNRIVKGVRELSSDHTKVLKKANGELGEVVDSINTMVADIAQAHKEHEALLMAEAANLAQRDFLARMSHEIRTPMNGVLGMTHMAQNAKTEEQRMEYLDKIHSSASLLLGIINDILDFSKIEAGKMELERRPFDLGEVIENIGDLIRPRVSEKDLDLVILKDESVPDMAIGDGLRLSQVLLNLLGNAVKFTKEGSITLSIRAQTTADGDLRIDCSVRDTGIGMDAEQAAHVFTPFTQADSSTARQFGGTGLGLSISKALVELMGGGITVTSEPCGGSDFSFYVLFAPYDGEAGNRHLTPDAAALQSYEGFTVLVVEDNDINREIAKALMSEMGFETDMVENGEEGVEAFLQKDYDLIFMDIRMPVMDGLEATRRIRGIETNRNRTEPEAHPSHVPIIAMTANAMQEDRDASEASGMDGHISKPIIIEELQAILYRMLIQN